MKDVQFNNNLMESKLNFKLMKAPIDYIAFCRSLTISHVIHSNNFMFLRGIKLSQDEIKWSFSELIRR